VTAVQYAFTHKHYTEKQNVTDYPEWNIYNNKNIYTITIKLHNSQN